MTIGRYVKMKLAERGINQMQLAEMIGIKNQSNISMLLKGNMTTSKLFMLLDALECDLVIRDRITGEDRVLTQND